MRCAVLEGINGRLTHTVRAFKEFVIKPTVLEMGWYCICRYIIPALLFSKNTYRYDMSLSNALAK
jgi:hypothetical protein